MPRDLEKTTDAERGETLTSEEGGGSWTIHFPSDFGVGTTDNSSAEGLPRVLGTQQERRDFDDGANALWSHYGKEAKTHDEARFQSLADDMVGVFIFAGLFSAVITPFLVENLQNLRVDPAEQSAYYQNQSAYYQQQSAYYQQQSLAVLTQISQQIASAALQVSAPSTVPQSSVPPTQQVPNLSLSPLPYPTFKPSSSDLRVNTLWLISLVFALSAALFAVTFQQWVRSYMTVFQRYDHPLKRARFRQFFFEGSKGMRNSAKQVHRLIYLSLFLFFLGLCDSMLNTNTTIGLSTIAPIGLCGILYLYNVTTQTPYKTPFSSPIFSLMQRLTFFGAFFLHKPRGPKTFEAYREELVMEEDEERKKRDVRAIRWLVDNTTVNAEMEPLVLAIPGTFNTEWGREVWMNVSDERWTDPDTLEPQTDRPLTGGPAPLMPHSLRFPEGTAGDTICRSVRYLFETCKSHSYFENEDARRRRMRACVETAASLVCCIDYQSDWFGEVGKLVSEIGRIEEVNQSPVTTSDQSFIIRWTCFSLVSVQQVLRDDQLAVLAGYAVSGLARCQSEYGQPDETAWRSAQRIDECLKTAWELVEELQRAFEPWAQKRTMEQVKEILRRHEQQISGLERLQVEADGMADLDWRTSLYQDAMDDATFTLIQQLPGVSFDELRRSESFLIGDTFHTPATGSAPATPLLIFPGRRVQALAKFGTKLREVLNGPVADGHEVLDSLTFVDQVPVLLRWPTGLMSRQLWRLLDLRDGGGLGFTTELFFLSLRRLSSMLSLHEANHVFYIGAFKAITSHWEESKNSLGTHHILLNIICDLIIKGRGVISDVKYPEPITNVLVDMVGNMLREYVGPDGYIRDAVREIVSVDSRICMNMRLRRKALAALARFEAKRHELPQHLYV